MEKFIVLSIKPYEFNDGGKTISGMNVQYINPDEIYQEENMIGHPVFNARLDKDQEKKFLSVPGVYEMEFRMKPNSKGKPELMLKDVNHIASFSFIQDKKVS